jgi:hypothetical protein
MSSSRSSDLLSYNPPDMEPRYFANEISGTKGDK